MKFVIFMLLALTILVSSARGEESEQIKLLRALAKVDLNKSVYNALQNYRRGVKEFQEKVPAEIEIAKRHASRIPTDCVSALGNLETVFGANSSCSGYVESLFGSSLSQTTVSSYCTNCQGAIAQALGFVGKYCPTTSRLSSSFIDAVIYNKFICTQDASGNYCVVNIINSLSTLEELDFTNVTSTQLDTVCSNCTITAVKALASAGLVNIPEALKGIVILRALCVKLNGQFCALSVQNSLNNAKGAVEALNSGQAPTTGQFNAILNAVCNPCFSLFFTRLGAIDPTELSSYTFTSIFAGLCRKDTSGSYCVVDIANSVPTAIVATLGNHNPCANITETSCPTTCSNLLNDLVQNVGCCWGLAADLSGINATYAKAHFASCFSNPGVVPDVCPSYSNATITWTYGNVNATWLQDAANAQKFLIQVAADIAFATTGTLSNPSLGLSRKRSGIVTVSGTVTSGASNAIALESGDTSCENVCSNVDATLNSSCPISVQSSSVTNVKFLSTAPFIAFSASLLVLSLLIASLF